MSDTKAVERIEAFKKEFLAEGSECTWKDYPLATDVLDWLRLQEQNFHQELQKARESERARIEDEFAKVAKYTQDFESDAYGENPVNTSYYQLYEGQWEYIIKPKDQSELDQPSNK